MQLNGSILINLGEMNLFLNLKLFLVDLFMNCMMGEVALL